MKSNLKQGIAVLLIMAALSGCAGFETPRVSLVNIGIREVQLFETIFNVELRVINNNDTPLTIRGMDCQLEINGKSIAQGVSDSTTEIPAYGTAKIPITLYSSAAAMLKGALAFGKDDSFKYKVSGKIRLDSQIAFLPSVIPFSSDGDWGKK